MPVKEDLLVHAKHRLQQAGQYLITFLRWALIATVVGGVVGLLGTVFYITLHEAGNLRAKFPFLVYALPLAGILIVFIYRACGVRESRGTNLVLESIYSEENVPLIMTPLIFVATAISHLFGASVGKEGAALQIGGSLAHSIGRLFRLDQKDVKIITMCGMSACFSAVFGTPIAAAVFSMEVVSVGVMHYAALVPCALSAIIGVSVARLFQIPPFFHAVTGVPDGISLLPALRVLALGVLCAAVSVLFCWALRKTGKCFKKLFPNSYLRAFVGGLAAIGLMLLFGQDYMGTGFPIIEQAVGGFARPEAFLLKIIFTAVCISACFKGGEIVPTFFVGATFGCVAGGLLGLSPSFGAALGMVAVFCGVTNCPITTLLLSFEIFGYTGAPYFLIVIAVSYMLSGYYSLYSKQKILYSKMKPVFINRHSN